MLDATLDGPDILIALAALVGVVLGGTIGHLSGYRLARLQLDRADAQRETALRREVFARLSGLIFEWASAEGAAMRAQLSFMALLPPDEGDVCEFLFWSGCARARPSTSDGQTSTRRPP